jgi:hypothetical protein
MQARDTVQCAIISTTLGHDSDERTFVILQLHVVYTVADCRLEISYLNEVLEGIIPFPVDETDYSRETSAVFFVLIKSEEPHASSSGAKTIN